MNVKCFKRLGLGDVVKHHDTNEKDAVNYYMVIENDGKQLWLQSISSYHQVIFVLDDIEENEEIIEEITEYYSKDRPVCLEPRYYIELLGGIPYHQN